MPSADELRKLFSKEDIVQEFVNKALREVEYAAKMGNTCDTISIPDHITLKEGERILKETFPDCKVYWKYFSRYYFISWKPT